MKIAGIVFIIASSISAAIRIGIVLKKRCIYLRQLIQAFYLLKNELLFSVKPLSQVFLTVSQSLEGSAKAVFSDLSKQMENNRWITLGSAMQLTLKQHQDDPSKEILLELAERMGKYDLDAQISGVDLAMERMQKLLNMTESECGIKSKTYKTLSICAGLAMVILLL